MRSMWIGAALAAAALGGPAMGQAPASPAPAGGRGEALYGERCKECHESGDERAPTREQLAAKTAAEILAAITTGPMTPMAEGLTPEEKQAVAAFVSKR